MDAPTRIDKHRERSRFVHAIRIRHRVDVGKRITIVAEAVTNALNRVNDLLPGEGLAGTKQQKRAHLCLCNLQLTLKFNVGNFIYRPFGDVDRDVDLFLIRRDRNLGRFNVEFEVSAIEVIRLQFLQIAGQFLL